MAETNSRLANLFLRYASTFAGLRRVPVLGRFLSWTSRKLVPRESLVWVQIQQGPAQGLWVRVSPRTGRNVLEGVGEPEVQQAILEHLRPGMAAGHVVSLEADPEIAARLRENLSRNAFVHAQVEEKAIWSEAGKVSFMRVDTNTSPDRGLGHVSSDLSGSGTIAVEAVTLDAFAASHPAPDFVKCDVEGAELHVFQGAACLLDTKRPLLLVEMHSRESHQSLLEQFSGAGYRCHNLDATHVLALPQ